MNSQNELQTQTDSNATQIKIETTKCQVCKKKLKLIEQATSKCKCSLLFCKIHKNNHNCTFDYKLQHQENVEKMNPKVQFEKTIKI